MVKNLNKEKAILADRQMQREQTCHTYSFMQMFCTHVPFSQACEKNSSCSTVLQFHHFFTSHIWDYVPFYQICLTFTS